MTPTAPRRARHGAQAAVTGTLLATTIAFGLAGCGGSGNRGVGRLDVNGQVTVTSAHGATHTGSSGLVLQTGDRIQVTSGEAMVSLVPNGQLHLRAGTVLTMNKTPDLADGSVLVQPSGTAVRVSAERATLDVVSGAAQLSVGSGTSDLTAKVYQATSRLDVPGNPSVTVAAPRQVILTADTHLPVAPVPLQYRDGDSWDRLFLATAVSISTQLGAAVSGFDAQLASNQGMDASYYQQLLPALSGRSDFVSAFETVEKQPAAQARPGDYLIASDIALRGKRGSFTDRLNGELLFASQGASWGFVAYDQGVTDLNGVLSDVLAAIGRAALPFTGTPNPQIAIGPPATTTPPTTRPPRTTPTTVPATSSPTRNTPTTPPTTAPPAVTPTTAPGVLPGVLGQLLNPLLDPLLQALNNILGGKH